MIHIILGAVAAAHVAKHAHKAITRHVAKHGGRILGNAWSQGANHVHKHTTQFIANQAAQNGGVRFK